jgi:hypothetical protein
MLRMQKIFDDEESSLKAREGGREPSPKKQSVSGLLEKLRIEYARS